MNPFWTGDRGENRSKVWAYGLRNPFPFELEPGGGGWIGDVGWNRWEEVNVASRGANFGWPCYESRCRPPEYANEDVCRDLYARGRAAVRFPRLAYERGSVTGGVFYSGDAFPRAYRGAHVFGDWSRSSASSRRASAGRGATSRRGPPGGRAHGHCRRRPALRGRERGRAQADRVRERLGAGAASPAMRR